MNLNTLIEFRHGVYQSFRQARDALFNLVDALASEDRAQSLPELSLSPAFERKWSSTYEALEDGIIDAQSGAMTPRGQAILNPHIGWPPGPARGPVGNAVMAGQPGIGIRYRGGCAGRWRLFGF